MARIYKYDKSTGVIVAERLFDCHIEREAEKIYREICPRDSLQIGFDRKGNKKLFDYGIGKDVPKIELSKVQKEEIKRYALKRL